MGNKKKGFQNYWKLPQKEKRFQAILISFLSISQSTQLVNLNTDQMRKSHSEHTLEDMKKSLGKFGAVEHEKYTNFILPRHPGEI